MKIILSIIESKTFKVTTFIISISFFLSTLFIKFDFESLQSWGYLGIFIFNIFSSGILLIPQLIDQVNPIVFTLVSALGMTLNESVNYYVGYISNDLIKETETEKKIELFLRKYMYYGIFFLALIPFPFDMIGTFSGRLNVNFAKYILTILSARIVRFSLIIYAFKVLV